MNTQNRVFKKLAQAEKKLSYLQKVELASKFKDLVLKRNQLLDALKSKGFDDVKQIFLTRRK